MNFLSRGCFRTLGLAAMVVGGMVATKANAAIAYTTSTTAGTASNTNTQTPGNGVGYTFASANSASTYAFTTNLPSFRFTANTASVSRHLASIGINVFYADGGGSSSGSLANSTLNWTLYDNTAAAQVATMTTALGALSHTGGPNANYGANSYQNQAFTVVTGSNLLVNTHQYTLMLKGGTLNASGTVTNDSLVWNSYVANPATTGQTFTGVTQGTLGSSATGSGTFVGATTVAFDITAAPEPSTLILYSAAAGGFFFFSFFRWRKAKAKSGLVVA